MESALSGDWLALALGLIFSFACLYLFLAIGALAERAGELTELFEDVDARVERLERVIADARDRKARK